MKNIIFAILLITSILVTCKPKEVDVLLLKVGLGHGKSHSFTLALEQFKDKIEADSEGKIKVKIYPASQLGNESEMQEMLTIGSLDMAVTGLVNNYEPLFSVFELPYLFRDRGHVASVKNSSILKNTGSSLGKNGLRLVGWYENGLRHITNSKRAINGAEDLKGLLIRTPENMAQVETLRAMGAIPTPLSYSELYTALIQGVVDGQENPLQNIWNGRFYEAQSHVALTGHIFNCTYVLISKKKWNQLTADQQMLIEKCITYSTEWQLDYMREQDNILRKKLEEAGMQFTEPDRKVFEKSTESVYEYFYSVYGDRARELVREIREKE